jgi:hypothetical protein
MTDIPGTIAVFTKFTTTANGVGLFTFEIPVDKGEANAALQALGGVPDRSEPRWVAIVRVTEQTARVQPKATSEPPKPVERLRLKKTWAELTPAQQSGIRCQEQEFENFLAKHHWLPPGGAAEFVREYCEVGSRSMILTGTKAAQRWNLLESAYQAHLSERQYAEVIR